MSKNKIFFYQTIQDTVALYFFTPLKILNKNSLTDIYNFCKDRKFMKLNYETEDTFYQEINSLVEKYSDFFIDKKLTMKFDFIKELKSIEDFLSYTRSSFQPFFLRAIFENKNARSLRVLLYIYLIYNIKKDKEIKFFNFYYKLFDIGNKYLLVGPILSDHRFENDDVRMEYIRIVKDILNLDLHTYEFLNLLNHRNVIDINEINKKENIIKRLFKTTEYYFDAKSSYNKIMLRDISYKMIYQAISNKKSKKTLQLLKEKIINIERKVLNNQVLRNLEAYEWFNDLTFKNMTFDTDFSESTHAPILFLKQRIQSDGYIFCRYYQYNNSFELAEHSDIPPSIKSSLQTHIHKANNDKSLLKTTLSYKVVRDYEENKIPIQVFSDLEECNSKFCEHDTKINSVISLPLVFDKKVFAILHFIAYKKYAFDDIDKRFLLKLSSALSRKYIDNIFDAGVEKMISLLEEFHTQKSSLYKNKKTDQVCKDIAKMFSSDGVILWFNKQEIFHHTQREFDEILIESEVNFLDEDEKRRGDFYPISKDADESLIKINSNKDIVVIEDIESKCSNNPKSKYYMKYKDDFIRKGIKSFMLAIIKNYKGRITGALMVFNKSKREYNKLSQRMLVRVALHIGSILNTLIYTNYNAQRMDERVLHESGQYLNIIDSRAKDMERRLKKIYINSTYERHKLFLHIEDIKDYISYTKSFLFRLFKDGDVVKRYDELLEKDIKSIKLNSEYNYTNKLVNQVLAVYEQKMQYQKNIRYKNLIYHKTKIKLPNKQFHDILSNLINNAIKYGKVGTYIKISDEMTDYYYNIYIENIGYKIDKEEISDIFRKGVRGRVTKEILKDKEEFKESISENKGIGLFFVKEILKSIKGNVKIVENTPIDNRFSKNLFEIKIPIKYVRKVI